MRAAGKEEPLTRIRLPAAAKPAPVFLALAGDVTEASAAALAATLVPGSDVQLENVLLNPGRGGCFAALRRMGADIEAVQRRERFGEAQGTLRVRAADLLARRFDAGALADLRDEVFLLLAAAVHAEGESVFRDLDWLRLGEIDLLRDFTAALKRAGVETGEIEDGLVIRGRGESDGGRYESFGHPGLAAACAVMALKSHGASSLAGADALEHRHPGLLDRIASLSTAAAAEKTA
jgi:3-phosphoshikimate 1-carboxyvinyltransferase